MYWTKNNLYWTKNKRIGITIYRESTKNRTTPSKNKTREMKVEPSKNSVYWTKNSLALLVRLRTSRALDMLDIH